MTEQKQIILKKTKVTVPGGIVAYVLVRSG